MTAWRKYFSWIGKEKIDRAPRIKLGSLENCWLLYRAENVLQKFEIENISTSGLAIRKTKACPFEAGKNYHATLALGDKKVKMGFIAVHIKDDIVGCSFDKSNPTLSADILTYLKVQISAHNLNQVNEKFLDSEYRNKATWYTDGNYNQIFFTFENDQITEFQISFLGNHLNGGKDKPLLYGKLRHTDDLDPWIAWEGANSNTWRESAPTMAKQFIYQVAIIPDATKKLLTDAIDSSLTIPNPK